MDANLLRQPLLPLGDGGLKIGDREEPIGWLATQRFQSNRDQLTRIAAARTMWVWFGSELRGRPDGTIEDCFKQRGIIWRNDGPMKSDDAIQHRA